jgi:hypothetical protein
MSKLVLSEGHVTPDSPISVQLIKNHHPGTRPVVVIAWPGHPTTCSPAKLGEVIASATRILATQAPSWPRSTQACGMRHVITDGLGPIGWRA